MGLRRAFGATKVTVVAQVLNEALVFSFLGAILGLIVAHFSTSPLLELLVGYTAYSELTGIWSLHWRAVCISFISAVIAGQLLTFYPALIATRIPVVEALRNN